MTIDGELLREFLLGREENTHKRDYGHALLVCGCERMPGAAVLATGAALTCWIICTRDSVNCTDMSRKSIKISHYTLDTVV